MVPSSFRIASALAGMLVLLPLSAFAQAPATSPLVLTQPPSARVMALGGAWVAGRDQDVVFFNPAQLVGARNDFAVSLGHFTDGGHLASFASAYAGGKLSFTLGWGLQLANFMIDPGAVPPFSQDQLFGVRAGDAQSSLAVVAGALQYRGLKIGGSAKYAADRTDVNRSAFLADVGVARGLLGGVAAFAVQNLGPTVIDKHLPLAVVPLQVSGGWSGTRAAGPLDLAYFAQLTHRTDWTAPAAGLEAGYSWIEGYAVTGRIGVRRPETDSETPVSLGGAFTADRLTVEYAVRLFDDSRRAHVVTIRWR